MSDGAATGIDPRFDPRFQRGYSGHGASETDAAPARSASVSRIPEPPGAAHVVAPPPSAVPDPGVASDPAVTGGIRVISESAAAADGHDEQLADWTDDGEPFVESRTDPYFLTAWAVSAAVIVFGAALYWAGISGESLYGPTNASDRLLQTAAWLIAPALVQVGFLGLIAMIVWSGIRHARARRVRHARPAGDAVAREIELPA